MTQPTRSRLVTALFLAPGIVVFLGLFVAPLSFFFVQSFWKAGMLRIQPDFQFGNYAAAVDGYAVPLLRTLGVAFVVASLTTVFGFLFAYCARYALGYRLGPAVLLAALTTLFGGYLVKIYAWRTILGLDGILNSALQGLGIIDEPLQALLFNTGAVIVTLTHYLLPLAILPLFGALRDVDENQILAAKDLGASPLRAIFAVVLPRVRTALIASFATCFLLAAGDYVTPALVGSPGSAMYGNFIQTQFGLRMNTPQGAAMSFTLIAASLAVLLAVSASLTLGLGRRRR